ncbi:ferritin-like domain-containing protein [Halococcus saccharolyticus]|uniref:Ferritin-like domain-containing protein n=1 Tax=Halococcus saccharolyticus DSM 5350 TaxID=1227455 RepID=M0MRA3_9EURY|nr:ferritin-like domain-containing protein [Halococcus saccharolyticus]EMA47888.1 hypothetical protein C449_00410 [Halococcus saccharolyticus DSM 5350]
MSNDTIAERIEAGESFVDPDDFEFDNADDDIDRENESTRDLLGRVSGALNRRSFMGNAAKAGAGAVALGTLASGSAAAYHEASDVDILNFALTLEHLEAAYYNEFLDEHSEGEVERSDAIGAKFADPQLQYSTWQEIVAIRDHEEAHVDALTKTIKDLGGTPVEAAEYEFPYSTMEEFVKFSNRVEAVGTSAYAGAAPFLDNEAVVEAGLSIHSVEARHTSYFGALLPKSSMPNAFDPARSMDQVVGIVSPLIVSE